MLCTFFYEQHSSKYQGNISEECAPESSFLLLSAASSALLILLSSSHLYLPDKEKKISHQFLNQERKIIEYNNQGTHERNASQLRR